MLISGPEAGTDYTAVCVPALRVCVPTLRFNLLFFGPDHGGLSLDVRSKDAGTLSGNSVSPVKLSLSAYVPSNQIQLLKDKHFKLELTATRHSPYDRGCKTGCRVRRHV